MLNTCMNKTLYLVDASAYLFRSYHAIREMSNPQGLSTNALFGFVRSILKIISDFSVENLVVVFDGPNGNQTRLDIYPEYKANRSTIPDDLPHQLQWAREFCHLMGISILDIPGVEADDSIGSVAKWAESEGYTVFLCSGDKDLCQLINERIFMLQTHKDNLTLNTESIEEKYGIHPSQMIDYLAMVGDSADNVPGLPGFGPKTAANLLNEFHSLEHLLAHPEKVKNKKKQETLRTEAALARLSKELVTIDTSVSIPQEASFLQIQACQREELISFYQDKNFTKFLQELCSEIDIVEEEVEYHLVNDLTTLQDLSQRLSTEKEICFDTETTGLRPLEAKLVGIGLGVTEKEAWYVPTNGNISLEVVIETLRPLFENPQIGFYAQNAKYDFHILKQHGITITKLCFDTMLASYILNSDLRRHSLDQLALSYFNKTKTSTEDLIGKGKKAITMAEVPIERVSKYCCEDVDYTCRLKNLLEKELKERKLSHLLHELELPVLRILASMEEHGIYLDTSFLDTMSVEITASIEALVKEIHTLAGEEFLVSSPKQLSQILFEKLEIPAPKKTATGFSTNAEVLETLKARYPIAAHLLRYRSLEKLRSTYIDSLPGEVNPKTKRIHCSFRQSVAATGRLSCQDPNLQNIPIRTEEGRLIRQAFLPQDPNSSFLAADYSQIELRILAHLSDDPQLIKAFQNNEDIHSFTASLIFNVPLDQVTKTQRYNAKAVNFGIIYGQQAFGLAKELKVSRKDAAAFIETYFERYPNVRAFIESCHEQARSTGKSFTMIGRERHIANINSKNKMLKSAAERLAVNSPIQGSAADLIKSAMISVDKQLSINNLKSNMILQIHDELLFECPDHEIATLSPMVESTMESVYSLKVPLKVNITVGKNWKEC